MTRLVASLGGSNARIRAALVAGLGTPPAQLVRVLLAEFPTPLVHRLICHHDTAFRKEFLDITIAEAEAEVEPHRVSDKFLRKAKAYVGRSSDVCFHSHSMTHPRGLPCRIITKLTMPFVAPEQQEKVQYAAC